MGKWWLLTMPASFALPWLLGNAYYVHLANMVAIVFVLIASLNLIFGVAGQITVGHAAFYGIGAYTTAILMREGVTFWLATPAGLLVAGLAGLILGLPCLRLRHYHLAMATLGFAIVFQVVVVNWQSVTGGAAGLVNIPRPALGDFVLKDDARFFLLSCAAAWLAHAVTRNLVLTGPGLCMRALRESESAAEALGVNLTRMKLLAFSMSTALAGLAGGLYASFARYIAPEDFFLEMSVVALTVAVVGGLGSNLGALLGAGLMVLLPQMLEDLGAHPVLVYSVALGLVLLFFPRGLAGVVMAGGRLLRRAVGATPGGGVVR